MNIEQGPGFATGQLRRGKMSKGHRVARYELRVTSCGLRVAGCGSVRCRVSPPKNGGIFDRCPISALTSYGGQAAPPLACGAAPPKDGGISATLRQV
ncbi:MAG: hypothetical protein JRK53_16200 [Deltaproteobacteria bacterium]|nr:hypothetical protein [Deltaproteobacteria bacterium]